MQPMKVTALSRLLCWLGLHQPVVTGYYRDEHGNERSAIGGCVRGCNGSWQWDNA